jgi:hypothetical protein
MTRAGGFSANALASIEAMSRAPIRERTDDGDIFGCPPGIRKGRYSPQALFGFWRRATSFPRRLLFT